MKTQPLGNPKPNPGDPRYDVTRSDFKAPAGGALDPASPGWKPPAPSSTRFPGRGFASPILQYLPHHRGNLRHQILRLGHDTDLVCKSMS